MRRRLTFGLVLALLASIPSVAPAAAAPVSRTIVSASCTIDRVGSRSTGVILGYDVTAYISGAPTRVTATLWQSRERPTLTARLETDMNLVGVMTAVPYSLYIDTFSEGIYLPYSTAIIKAYWDGSTVVSKKVACT